MLLTQLKAHIVAACAASCEPQDGKMMAFNPATLEQYLTGIDGVLSKLYPEIAPLEPASVKVVTDLIVGIFHGVVVNLPSSNAVNPPPA